MTHLDKALENICLTEGVYPKELAEAALDFALRVERETVMSFICLDCHVHTGRLKEYYMVKDELWESVVPDGEGMLCAGCLCKRLGRKLEPSDFDDVPINYDDTPRSERLQAMINNRVCKEDDCYKPLKAKGWCSMHYYRFTVHGDPSATLKVYGLDRSNVDAVKAYLDARSVDVGGCRVWNTDNTSNRYGWVSSGNINQSAHSLSYEINVGSIPDGMNVLHRCDNGLCIRPEHLFLGSHAENMADKVAKGRQVKGDRINTSKLNEGAVIEIRRRLSDGDSHRDIALEYSVDESTIRAIRDGKTWKHLGGTTT